MVKLIPAFLLLAAAGLEAANDYCHVCADHTMCKFPTPKPGPACHHYHTRALTKADKDEILKAHNEYRNKVALGKEQRGKGHSQPPAANMRKMTWDDELAVIAQRWASQCKFEHDSCRDTRDKEVAGQCMVLSYEHGLHKVEWTKEINNFIAEVDLRDGELNTKPFTLVGFPGTGHFTQVVWAETHKVGCGFAEYTADAAGKDWQRIVVCNYSPGGNVGDEVAYAAGPAASKCPAGTRRDSTYPGLCAWAAEGPQGGVH